MNLSAAISNILRHWLGLLCILAGLLPSPQASWSAESIPFELQGVGISDRFGQQVDLGLRFRNEQGQTVTLGSVFNGKQPVLVFLAYYECPNLCNLFLNGATETLEKLKWTAGHQFQIVTISFDPREDSKLAAAKKKTHLEEYGRPEAEKGWHFWVNDKPARADAEDINVKRLASQLGFGYRYDKRQKQYAHAAAMIVLTPEGRISRYLYGIDVPEKDLRLALVEAGGGKIGTLADRLLLFCYHYDPLGKKYAVYATNLMKIGGAFTIAILGTVLTGYWARGRRRRTDSGNIS